MTTDKSNGFVVARRSVWAPWVFPVFLRYYENFCKTTVLKGLDVFPAYVSR
jgi:hypothetical protein